VNNKIQKIGNLILTVFTLLLFSSCSLQTDTENTPINTPRNLNWSMEKITFNGTISPDNIRIRELPNNGLYLITHNNENNSVIFNFDGSNWKNINFDLENTIITDLQTFSDNNLWAVGFLTNQSDTNCSAIFHFNGSSWQQMKLSEKGKLRCIWGNSPSDIWAGGHLQTIYHYNGNEWQLQNYETTIRTSTWDSNYEYVFNIMGNSSSGYFTIIHDRKFYNSISKLLRFGNDQGIHLMSFYLSSGHLDFWLSSEGTTFIQGLSRFLEMKNSESITSISTDVKINSIHGNSYTNIFAAGENAVYHYDGNDLFEYKDFKNMGLTFYCVWVSSSEVFLVGYDSQSKQELVVFRGK
jgi:hypothetical protein